MYLLALLLALTTFLNVEEMDREEYLNRIVSISDWEKSQKQGYLELMQDDQQFIHLAKEDQLRGIIQKYWSKRPDFVVLKIDTAQLPGHLIYETNSGGTNKHYHPPTQKGVS